MNAYGSKVVIAVDEGKRTHRGLHLGREVDRPFGVVISAGPRSGAEALIGERVFFQRDLGEELEWRGLRIAVLDERSHQCDHCDRQLTERPQILGRVHYPERGAAPELQAWGRRCIVRPEVGDDTRGALVLGRREERPFGRVLNVGERCDEDVQVGQRVWWRRDLGAEVEWEGEHLAVLDPHGQRCRCGFVVAAPEVVGVVGEEELAANIEATHDPRAPRLATDAGWTQGGVASARTSGHLLGDLDPTRPFALTSVKGAAR